MKALKEKRISLRSLWRRGLVILSLFALVFASCGDSDSGSSDDGLKPGKVPIAIELLTTSISTVSYEGQPVDLTGLKVLVRYSTDPKDNVILTKDNTKFYTDPPYAVGVIGEASATAGVYSGDGDIYWVPQRNYTLTFSPGAGEPIYSREIQIGGVYPIARQSSWQDTPNSANNGFGGIYNMGNTISAFWSQGLQLTGPLDTEIRVDDYPKLEALKLQAQYSNGAKKDIDVIKSTDWEIRARNTNAPGQKPVSGPGDLFVTVGYNRFAYTSKTSSTVDKYVQNAYDLASKAMTSGSDAITLVFPTVTASDTGWKKNVYNTIQKSGVDPALTASHPFTKVHTVIPYGVELLPADLTLDPFFYWDSDSGTSWVDRLIAKKASIRVTYSDEKTNEMTVEEAVRMNAVWRNLSPGQSKYEVPFGVLGIYETGGSQYTHAKNKDPKITIDYRGGVTTKSVPVYTKLQSLSVRFTEGTEFTVDMKGSDNDVGAFAAAGFAGKITVEAIFTSPTTSETATKTLAYASAADLDKAKEGAPSNPNNYTMDFGAHDKWVGVSTTNPNGWDETGAGAGWGVCRDPKNNGKAKAVTVYYQPPVEGTPASVVNSGIASASKKSQKIIPNWVNIHVK